MQTTKWVTFSLAATAFSSHLAFAAPFVEDQSEAKGFVDGSKLDVLLTNYYFNRNNRNDVHDNKDWTQGIKGNFTSGYTQGLIGVGVDAFGFFAMKLDGSDKYSGSGNLSTSSDGSNNDNQGKAGAALKLRISKTELKIGDMQTSTSPVFSTGGSRILPHTASGIQLQSSDIKDLNLEAGHFYSSTGSNSNARDGGIFATYAGAEAKTIDYFGGRYSVTDNLSASLYASKLEDIWNQYYANLNYTIAMGDDQSLNLDGNIYRTTDTGKALAGDISNTTFSLGAAYSFLTAHTLSVSFQKVNSDTPFDYVGVGKNNWGSDSIFLANSVQYSDFTAPNEKSAQVRYDLNMASYGAPGLSFLTRYIRGWGIDGTHAPADSAYLGKYGDDGKHHEVDFEAKYVVQTGTVKGLSLRLRQAWHRANASEGEGDVDEFRLIADYPISIF